MGNLRGTKRPLPEALAGTANPDAGRIFLNPSLSGGAPNRPPDRP